MRNSILYFLLEGLSRGGIQFFLLFISYYYGENIYVTLMLLVSLETLIPLFFPTNYIDALLPLLKKYSEQEITSNFFVFNFIFFVVFGLVFIVFIQQLQEYYNYDNTYVYFLILINVFLVRWLYFSAFMKQMEEKHINAIRIKGIPFILSLGLAILFVFLFEDKIFGFFVGKTLGLFIFYVYILLKTNITFSMNYKFLIDFSARSKYLVLIGLLGWATGYGFLNIAHTFYTETDTKNFAYILNLYMIFLMVIFGGMQVIRPKILKLVNTNAASIQLKTFYIKTMLLYSGVAILGFGIFMFIQILSLPSSVGNMLQNGNYAILLFLLVAAESTARLFVYAKDDIKNFTQKIVSVELIGWLLVLILLYAQETKMFLIYFTLVTIRTLYVIYYTYKRTFS